MEDYVSFQHRGPRIGLYNEYEYSTSGDTDEGYFRNKYSYHRDWEYEGEDVRVRFCYHESSRDCDGPYEAYGEEFLYVKDGKVFKTERIASRQRDYYAELMGY